MEEYKPPILIKELGMRFPTEKSKERARYGLYKCGYCGKEFQVQMASVKSKSTKSCGCLLKKHGLRHHRLYYTWMSMKLRCYSKYHASYEEYGGRGITVCDEWRETPTQFIEDMFPSFQEGLSLDRIDNDKGYFKENCRWSTLTEQALNKRPLKSNNTSGYTGVSFNKNAKLYEVYITLFKKRKHIGFYKTAIEAAIARNNYIIENNLPHKLNEI